MTTFAPTTTPTSLIDHHHCSAGKLVVTVDVSSTTTASHNTKYNQRSNSTDFDHCMVIGSATSPSLQNNTKDHHSVLYVETMSSFECMWIEPSTDHPNANDNETIHDDVDDDDVDHDDDGDIDQGTHNDTTTCHNSMEYESSVVNSSDMQKLQLSTSLLSDISLLLDPVIPIAPPSSSSHTQLPPTSTSLLSEISLLLDPIIPISSPSASPIMQPHPTATSTAVTATTTIDQSQLTSDSVKESIVTSFTSPEGSGNFHTTTTATPSVNGIHENDVSATTEVDNTHDGHLQKYTTTDTVECLTSLNQQGPVPEVVEERKENFIELIMRITALEEPTAELISMRGGSNSKNNNDTSANEKNRLDDNICHNDDAGISCNENNVSTTHTTGISSTTTGQLYGDLIPSSGNNLEHDNTTDSHIASKNNNNDDNNIHSNHQESNFEEGIDSEPYQQQSSHVSNIVEHLSTINNNHDDTRNPTITNKEYDYDPKSNMNCSSSYDGNLILVESIDDSTIDCVANDTNYQTDTTIESLVPKAIPSCTRSGAPTNSTNLIETPAAITTNTTTNIPTSLDQIISNTINHHNPSFDNSTVGREDSSNIAKKDKKDDVLDTSKNANNDDDVDDDDIELTWRLDPSISLSDWTVQVRKKKFVFDNSILAGSDHNNNKNKQNSICVDIYPVHKSIMAVGSRKSYYFAHEYKRITNAMKRRQKEFEYEQHQQMILAKKKAQEQEQEKRRKLEKKKRQQLQHQRELEAVTCARTIKNGQTDSNSTTSASSTLARLVQIGCVLLGTDDYQIDEEEEEEVQEDTTTKSTTMTPAMEVAVVDNNRRMDDSNIPVTSTSSSSGQNNTESSLSVFDQNNITEFVLDELAADVIPLVLDYMYSSIGRLEICTEHATGLYYVSKLWDIRSLQTRVEQYWKQDLSMSTVLLYYQHARILSPDCNTIIELAEKLCAKHLFELNEIDVLRLLQTIDPTFMCNVLDIVTKEMHEQQQQQQQQKQQHQHRIHEDVDKLYYQLSLLIAVYCNIHRKLLDPDMFWKLTDINYIPKLDPKAAKSLLDTQDYIVGPNLCLTSLTTRCISVLSKHWDETLSIHFGQLTLAEVARAATATTPTTTTTITEEEEDDDDDLVVNKVRASSTTNIVSSSSSKRRGNNEEAWSSEEEEKKSYSIDDDDDEIENDNGVPPHNNDRVQVCTTTGSIDQSERSSITSTTTSRTTIEVPKLSGVAMEEFVTLALQNAKKQINRLDHINQMLREKNEQLENEVDFLLRVTTKHYRTQNNNSNSNESDNINNDDGSSMNTSTIANDNSNHDHNEQQEKQQQHSLSSSSQLIADVTTTTSSTKPDVSVSSTTTPYVRKDFNRSVVEGDSTKDSITKCTTNAAQRYLEARRLDVVGGKKGGI